MHRSAALGHLSSPYLLSFPSQNPPHPLPPWWFQVEYGGRQHVLSALVYVNIMNSMIITFSWTLQVPFCKIFLTESTERETGWQTRRLDGKVEYVLLNHETEKVEFYHVLLCKADLVESTCCSTTLVEAGQSRWIVWQYRQSRWRWALPGIEGGVLLCLAEKVDFLCCSTSIQGELVEFYCIGGEYVPPSKAE